MGIALSVVRISSKGERLLSLLEKFEHLNKVSRHELELFQTKSAVPQIEIRRKLSEMCTDLHRICRNIAGILRDSQMFDKSLGGLGLPV